jgi:hypothetical protein
MVDKYKLPPGILYNILKYIPRHDINDIKEVRYKIKLLSFIRDNITDTEDYFQIYNDISDMNFYTDMNDYMYISENYYFYIMFSHTSCACYIFLL